jgi:hypothetical protein
VEQKKKKKKSHVFGQWGSGSDFISKAGKSFTPSHSISIFVPYHNQFYYPPGTERNALVTNQLHFETKYHYRIYIPMLQ